MWKEQKECDRKSRIEAGDHIAECLTQEEEHMSWRNQYESKLGGASHDEKCRAGKEAMYIEEDEEEEDGVE